jgi:hypothetical protein
MQSQCCFASKYRRVLTDAVLQIQVRHDLTRSSTPQKGRYLWTPQPPTLAPLKGAAPLSQGLLYCVIPAHICKASTRCEAVQVVVTVFPARASLLLRLAACSVKLAQADQHGRR